MMVFNKLSVVHFPAVPGDPFSLDGDAMDGDVFHHPQVGKTERTGDLIPSPHHLVNIQKTMENHHF